MDAGLSTSSCRPLAHLPRACRRLAVPLFAARSIGDAMLDDTVLSCECGYEVAASDEAELIEEIRGHARDAHGIAFSIEDALLVILRSELEPESFSTSTRRREE
jgi:predicted small metal-binding protein